MPAPVYVTSNFSGTNEANSPRQAPGGTQAGDTLVGYLGATAGGDAGVVAPAGWTTISYDIESADRHHLLCVRTATTGTNDLGNLPTGAGSIKSIAVFRGEGTRTASAPDRPRTNITPGASAAVAANTIAGLGALQVLFAVVTQDSGELVAFDQPSTGLTIHQTFNSSSDRAVAWATRTGPPNPSGIASVRAQFTSGTGQQESWASSFLLGATVRSRHQLLL